MLDHPRSGTPDGYFPSGVTGVALLLLDLEISQMDRDTFGFESGNVGTVTLVASRHPRSVGGEVVDGHKLLIGTQQRLRQRPQVYPLQMRPIEVVDRVVEIKTVDVGDYFFHTPN